MYAHHKMIFWSHSFGICVQSIAILVVSAIIFVNSMINTQTTLCVAEEGLVFLTFNEVLPREDNLCVQLFHNFLSFNTSDLGLIY